MSKHFSEAAKSWDQDEHINRNKDFALAIDKFLPPTEKKLSFLDFGCGTGLLSQFFASNAKNIVGIDTTPEMLKEFDKKFNSNSSISSMLVNFETDPIPETLKQFDVIMSAMTFHHLKNPSLVLGLLKKHLAKDGQIFIIDLDKEDGTFHPDNEGMGVKHFGFSKEEIHEMAMKNNFSSVKFKIIHTIKKNNKEYPILITCLNNLS